MQSSKSAISMFLGEEEERNEVFQKNVDFVIQSNLNPSRTFELELNDFADWTLSEFDAYKKGYSQSSLTTTDPEQTGIKSDKRFFRELFHEIFKPDKTNYDQVVLSEEFDWRKRNVVGSIKDQLECGSCYAFATAAVVESLYARKKNLNEVIDFSPKQIRDCSSGNSGCKGGRFATSINFLKKNHGKIATWTSYPYTEQQEDCRKTGIEEIDLGSIDYRSLSKENETILAKALVLKGPLFIGLDTDSKLFMFYKSGVLQVEKCPTDVGELDHAMTLVGYGYDQQLKLPYWIIKNSYGRKWGEDGYLRLVKDAGNMCGVASWAAFAELT